MFLRFFEAKYQDFPDRHDFAIMRRMVHDCTQEDPNAG